MTDCQLSNGTLQLETLDKIFKNRYLKALENVQNRRYTTIPHKRNPETCNKSIGTESRSVEKGRQVGKEGGITNRLSETSECDGYVQ